MHYPFILYDPASKHYPVFNGLKDAPYVADLSPASPLLAHIDVRDQRLFQEILDEKMDGTYTWGVASYLERRDSLLGDCPQMVQEQRFIHLGLDVIVPLGTPLHAPLEAVVVEAGYESGEGNYGGFVMLRHALRSCQPFYSFYGHLRRNSLPPAGCLLDGGERFAEIGDFHENGNWFHHTHIQVITEKGREEGYASKGYCSSRDMERIDELCPSPVPLFKPR